MRAHGDCYIGIMSGTSMDGADAVLVDFSGERPAVLAAAHEPLLPVEKKLILGSITLGIVLLAVLALVSRLVG